MPSVSGSDFLQLDPAVAPARAMTDWLTEQVRDAVASGRLRPGDPLPPTRTLADDLRVSRGVVVEAYRRLTDEALVSARAGVGTVVTGTPLTTTAEFDSRPEAQAASPMLVPSGLPWSADVTASLGPDMIDLSPGLPDLTTFPRAAWLRAERETLGSLASRDLAYGDPAGHPRLRAVLAAWLTRTRGVRASADDLVVVAGVAQSLALVAHVLRARGDTTIAVEDPGSRGARDELEHWGLTPLGMPVDDEGIRVDGLSEADARAVVLTPAHQFPTGVVLSPQRRIELRQWASERPGRLVIEDDYDAEYRYDRAPVAAVQASAPESVVYTGSTSKTLAPALRIGWLVAPPGWRSALVATKHASDLGSPVLQQLTLARLVERGAYDAHIRRVRSRHRARRDALREALATRLPTARIQGVAAGLHLLVTFPTGRGLDDVDLAQRALAAGVATQPLSWHRQLPGPPGLVLGYAANPPDRLRVAVQRLAEATLA